MRHSKLIFATLFATFAWLSPASAQLTPSPTLRPVLDLNFLAASSLVSTLTLTRASTAYHYNSGGTLTSVGNNVVRLDHDPSTGLRKGLLMEPSATNLLPYSEDASSGWWPTGTVTLAYNNAIAPDGTTTATRLTDQVSGADQHGIGFNIDVAAFSDSTNYTWSTFVKAGTTSKFEIYGYNKAGTFCSYEVDMTGDGSMTAGSVGDNGICTMGGVQKLPNGWYRVAIVMNSGTGGGWPGFLHRLHDGSTGSWYAGTGTTTAYTWGGQVELGSYTTSYIKTTGSAATRSAEILTSTLGTWFSAKTGTLATQYVNVDANAGSSYRAFSLSATNAAGSFYNDGFFLGDQGTTVVSAIRSGSANTLFPGGTISGAGQVNRQALTYTPSSYAFSVNGSAATTSTTGSLPATDPAYAYLGSQPGGVMRSRWLQKVQYFNQRLRNELLADSASLPKSLTYQDIGGSASDLATYTFSTKAIGTADANRWVIVGVMGRSGSTQSATSVTIGGIAATEITSANGSSNSLSFWAANVPTGTTANVVVDFSGGMSRCGVVIWSVLHSKMPSLVASTTYNDTTFSGAVPVDAGGIALGILYSNGTTSMDWSGLTEDAEHDIVEIGARISGASATFSGYKSAWSVGNSSGGGYYNRGGLAITLK